MTNLAYQDIAGGTVHVYSKHPTLPKWERIARAWNELNRVACINVFLLKKGKLRKITRKGYDRFNKSL